jgi:hypothetical protein
MRVEDRCVPVMRDAGSTEDAAVPDGGGLPDGGGTPDGGPGECSSDADCADLAPACVMGACRSCTETACAEPLALRELVAVLCAASARREGDDALFDAFEALYCSARPELFPLLAALERGVAAGRITIDETAFAECRDAFGLSTFDDSPCAAALRGMVAADSPCQFDFECAAGFCNLAPDACSGACAALGSDSAPCDDDDQCGGGRLCISGGCETPPASGAACTSRCAPGLFCNAMMRCEAQRAAGGACRNTGPGGDCAENLACVDRACAAPPIEGEDCWPAFFGVRCAEGLRCDGTVCRPPRAMGADCTRTAQCAYGSRCHEGICAPILGLGATCAAGDPCAFGTGCIANRCTRLPDVGEACDAALSPACVRGACMGGTCTDLAPGAPCDRAAVAFDVLDSCGATSSCSGDVCAAEGVAGDSCGGASDPECRAPDLECDDSTGMCAELCPLL